MCLRRFEALVENPSSLGLSRERLLALVSDDELSVKSERIVFEAVLQCASDHGGTSDGQLAEQLIAPVRFVFMPREQLQYVLSEPLVKASPMVLIDVVSALADKHDATPQMARSSPRQGCQLIFLIGFSSKDGTKDSPVYDRLCKRFDPVTGAVTSIAPLPEYHDAVSAAALDGNIYVVASIVDKFTWDREGRFLLDQGRMAMLRATTRPRTNGAHTLSPDYLSRRSKGMCRCSGLQDLLGWRWQPGLNVLVGGGLVLCALAWNESRSRKTQHE